MYWQNYHTQDPLCEICAASQSHIVKYGPFDDCWDIKAKDPDILCIVCAGKIATAKEIRAWVKEWMAKPIRPPHNEEI